MSHNVIPLSNQRLIFVTGKGGVGKSTIAAALALAISKKGKRTLLVEIGEQSFYQSFFNRSEISYIPTELAPLFFVARWDSDSCLKEYILHYVKAEAIFNLFFHNPIMKAFVNVAPGLTELTILGKATSFLRKHSPTLDFDLVIIDSPSTGHAITLFNAPSAFAQSFPIGPLGSESRKIHEVLVNSNLTSYIIVTLAEELPSTEAIELFDKIVLDLQITPHLICNRILNPPLAKKQIEELSDKSSENSFTFLHYLKNKLELQEKHLTTLSEKDPSLIKIPLIFERDSFKLLNAMVADFDRSIN